MHFGCKVSAGISQERADTDASARQRAEAEAAEAHHRLAELQAMMQDVESAAANSHSQAGHIQVQPLSAMRAANKFKWCTHDYDIRNCF